MATATSGGLAFRLPSFGFKGAAARGQRRAQISIGLGFLKRGTQISIARLYSRGTREVVHDRLHGEDFEKL